MCVKELGPDMRLALLDCIGFLRTPGCFLVGRVLGQDIFLDGTEHECLKIVQQLYNILSAWLVGPRGDRANECDIDDRASAM